MKELVDKRMGILACAAAAVIVAGAFAGCGDDDDDGSAAADAAAEETFDGPPATVFMQAPVDNPVADFSDAVAAANAAAAAINRDGGIAGRELVVETCNDTDANAEVACVRKAARDDALAFVGSTFIFNSQAGGEILAKESIASVAAQGSNQAEYAAPINFPIYAPPFGILACPEQVTQASDAKRVSAIAQDLPIQRELLTTLQGVAGAAGVDYGGGVTVPTSQTDFAPAVQELSDLDAEAVVNVLAPTAQAPFYSAVRSVGGDFKAYCSGPTLYTTETLTQLGEQADEIYVSSGLPPTSEEFAQDNPVIQQFRDEMEAAADAGDDEAALDALINPSNALNAWLGMQIVKQVAGEVKGELTSESLLAALNEAEVNFDGVVPPIDFGQPAPPPLSRLFNPVMSLYRWDSGAGEFVAADAEQVNVLELLAAASKAGGGQ